jgi:cytochrome c oxidase assembly protein subunit 15
MKTPVTGSGDRTSESTVEPASTITTGQVGGSLKHVRRVALLCAVLVLIITSLSAFMRLSRAGLSCADWPQCYGQSMRQLQQGLRVTAGESDVTAAVRLAHRVAASVALLLVVLMVIDCLIVRPVPWAECRAALTLLALALFLAVLGRWSSDARVPAVAMGNLLGGFAMLALCWRLTWTDAGFAEPWLRAWAWIATALLTCQVALGGLVSASYAGTSCGSLADCVAAARSVPWSALDPWREPMLAAIPPVNPSGALAQSAHRICALVVVVALLPLALIAIRAGRSGPGALIVLLLAGEIGLGLLMANGASLAHAMMHNAFAALMFATVLQLTRHADVA